MYCICLVVFSSILQMHFATSVEGQSVRVRQYKIYRRYQALAVSLIHFGYILLIFANYYEPLKFPFLSAHFLHCNNGRRVSFSSFRKWVVLPELWKTGYATHCANKKNGYLLATTKQFLIIMKHRTCISDSTQMRSVILNCTVNIVSIQCKSVVTH